MKISNFKLLETKGKSPLDFEYVAQVDVTTGFFIWKRTEQRVIMRKFADYWFFVDNGKFTPESQVEALARAWTAKTGQKC